MPAADFPGEAEPRPGRRGTLGQALSGTLYRHTPFAALVVAYLICGTLVLRSLDRGLGFTLTDTYEWPVTLTVLYLFVTLIGAVVRDIIWKKRRPSSIETWKFVVARWFGPGRIAGTIIVLTTLPLLLTTMYGFRLSLTLIAPFRWDPLFAHLDSFLHFGRHPWEWLQPLFGRPLVTRFLDGLYVYGWFTALWLGSIWQTIHGREPVRSQFLLAFAVSWILLGTVAAFVFSSAGPAFYTQTTGLAGPYTPLLDYLHALHTEAPLFAVNNQVRLAATYTEWGGMTAMPSMHLAIVTVVVLAAIRTHGWLAWVFLPFLGAIFLGSVLLGWHYAIDGYAGILGASAIWWMTGRFVRWWADRRPRWSEPAK